MNFKKYLNKYTFDLIFAFIRNLASLLESDPPPPLLRVCGPREKVEDSRPVICLCLQAYYGLASWLFP